MIERVIQLICLLLSFGMVMKVIFVIEVKNIGCETYQQEKVTLPNYFCDNQA